MASGCDESGSTRSRSSSYEVEVVTAAEVVVALQ